MINNDNGSPSKIKRLTSKMKNLIPTKRRLIQLYAALLTNANLKGYVTGKIYTGNLKGVCSPGLNCYSCPGAVGACPLGSLQNSLSSANKSAPFYIFGILLLYGIMLGRWICGFLCPFGLVQDLLYKIKTPKLKKSKITRMLTPLKYVILVLFVFIIPLVYMFKDFPLPAFCKYICPAGTLGGAIGLLINPENSEMFGMLGPLFTWKFALMCSFIVGTVFIYRVFCRFLCPLGALYGLFNRFCALGIKLDRSSCIDCGLCISKCKMDIAHVGDRECIMCGECIPVCPTKAISWRGSKIILPDNEIDEISSDASLSDEEKENKLSAVRERRNKRVGVVRKVVAALMAVTLIAALIYYNFFDKPTPELTEPGVSEGTSVDVIADGKVTVINFWYTTCGPCIQELPHFDELATLYGDSVQFITVHRSDDDLADGDALSYINDNFADSKMIFAADSAGDAYFYSVGGLSSWPMTLVVDQNGVVMERKIGKISRDDLAAAINLALSMPEYDTTGIPEGNTVGTLLPNASLGVIE